MKTANTNELAKQASLAGIECIEAVDPQVASAIKDELNSQRHSLKLIASENYCSPAVQFAMGNWMSDKYAEGYPEHRFYSGCEQVDKVESLAAQYAKELFGAEHAFVQPHCGADANLLAFWAVIVARVQNPRLQELGLKRVDELSDEDYEELRQLLVNQTVVGMSLNSGGHLTHGYRHNISSKMMRSVCYDVDRKTERIDYDALRALVKKEKPLILLCGYSSYTRHINFKTMREIADEVGAVLMTDMAHFAGLVAGGVFKGENHPVPYSDIVTSTTHKTLRGPRGGLLLCKKEFEEVVNRACPMVMGGPMPHVMAAKAVAFKEALSSDFKGYAQQVVKNAQALATALEKEGIRLVAGGTENHLIVADISSFGLNGLQAERALGKARLLCNRNAIPFDPNGAWFTSGIRLGTPALTTLGMKEEQMQSVAQLIVKTLKNTKPGDKKSESLLDPEVEKEVHAAIDALKASFPLYPHLPELPWN